MVKEESCVAMANERRGLRRRGAGRRCERDERKDHESVGASCLACAKGRSWAWLSADSPRPRELEAQTLDERVRGRPQRASRPPPALCPGRDQQRSDALLDRAWAVCSRASLSISTTSESRFPPVALLLLSNPGPPLTGQAQITMLPFGRTPAPIGTCASVADVDRAASDAWS